MRVPENQSKDNSSSPNVPSRKIHPKWQGISMFDSSPTHTQKALLTVTPQPIRRSPEGPLVPPILDIREQATVSCSGKLRRKGRPVDMWSEI